MDVDPPSNGPRKVRFAPKGPPRRKARPIEPKPEDNDNAEDEAAAQALLQRLNDQLTRRGPKVEKQTSVQVAFGHGAQSSFMRTYGRKLKERTDYIDGVGESSTSAANGAYKKKKKKEYQEPWDYHHSYYPITLPLRRPYSGDPELLDETEFVEGAEYTEDVENTINSASELGLLEENYEAQMLFFQLPRNLPLVKRMATEDTVESLESSESEAALASGKGKEISETLVSGGGTASAKGKGKGKEKVGSVASRDSSVPKTAKGKEKVGSVASRDSGVPKSAKGKEKVDSVASMDSDVRQNAEDKEIVNSTIYSSKINALKKGCSLGELPGGYMGKMLVYKSGAIKLKLGDTLYDVSPGSNCMFAQDIMVINPADKQCCMLGELGKRAVVTPDVDSLLSSLLRDQPGLRLTSANVANL